MHPAARSRMEHIVAAAGHESDAEPSARQVLHRHGSRPSSPVGLGERIQKGRLLAGGVECCADLPTKVGSAERCCRR